MQKILVTGAAGFIGYHLAQRLLMMNKKVVGLDNLNTYYDVELKQARLKALQTNDLFRFFKMDLKDDYLFELFEKENFDVVYHLAAQAGVRYSLENPKSYIDSNLVGFANILEACRHVQVKHLLYASTSSVYGANRRTPYSIDQNVDHPITLYAATKKSNEVMAHSYSHLFGIPTTGLRFFTVYGPYGRPDMAPFKFTKAILEGKTIQIYNNGHMKRDFTYVDDIVESLVRLIDKIPAAHPAWDPWNPNPAISSAPFRIYNIGNSQPVGLMEFIKTLEEVLGKDAEKEFLPLQPGEVLETHADVTALTELVDYKPNTPLDIGIQKFVDWYREFYQQ
ncbi:MAG: NAD-dependent epimerase [Oligoflexus sp.]